MIEARRRWVYCCRWNAEKTHAPYRNIVVDHDDELIGQMWRLGDLFDEAGIQDGDEFEIVIRKTGGRPFGDRKIVLIAPHTYERECGPAEEV